MQNNTVAYHEQIVKSALESVSKGYSIFLLAPGAKVPLKGTKGTWLERATRDEETIRAWFALTPAANYGIALTSRDLIIDCDPKNYPPAYPTDTEDWIIKVPDAELNLTSRHNTMLDLLRDCPALYNTRIVHTPSNGYHFYLRKPADDRIAKHVPAYPGVDFLSEGQLVVGPGSTRKQGWYALVEAKRATEVIYSG